MELKVGDVMTRAVIYVDINDNVQKAAEVMKNNNISSVIVMDRGSGVGIVTERDIITKIVAERKDPKKTLINEIMTSPLITIKPSEDIDDAARIMRDNDIRRLVVTQNDKIIGILTEFDIVKVEPALHLLIREHTMWDIGDVPAVESGTISGICEVCENYSESLRSVDGRMCCNGCI